MTSLPNGRLRSSEDDRGVTLLLFALLITALLVITALVVDLSFVRQNRQDGKSSADFAAAAGIRSLDDGNGQVRPWPGICAARDYLKANNPKFAVMTESFQTGTGGSVGVSNPCTSPPSTLCVDSAPSTWGVFTGLADGGRIRVTIRNGYRTPDPAFPEDASTGYSGDPSDECLQLAVIVEEREDAFFGGVAGASGYETAIRSVARAQRTGGGDIAPAVLLLERTRCAVLTTAGTNATVEARGRNGAAGTIHADSIATDSGCANNNKIFDVDGSPSAPAIKALAGVDGSQPGSITATALVSAIPTARPQFTADDPAETCVQTNLTECVGSPVTGGALIPRGVVGRGVVDGRYLTHVRSLRDAAAARFGWTDAQATANGFSVFPCGHAGAFTGAKIFVSCAGGNFAGAGKTFPANSEVVVNGFITLGGTLNLGDNTRVYVRGRVGGNERALEVGSGNAIRQNTGGAVNCDVRYAGAPSSRGLLVVGNGTFTASGGTLRLCQTTVVMLDNKTANCAIPNSAGLAPYANGCVGAVNFGGGVVIDWSAPNVNDVSTPTDAQLANLEDLALWTETQSGNSVSGGGGMSLAGIYFSPNADPFVVGGGGTIDLLDAQFVSRRLRANGGGTLTISPKAPNAVTLPALSGFTLAR